MSFHTNVENTGPPPPSQCGERLLPVLIDERAAAHHSRPLFRISVSDKNVDQGFRDISYALFANAINRLTHWMRHNLGRPQHEAQPFVYLASLDLRYHITLMAAVKAGFSVFVPSPRNSVDAFASLLDQCSTANILLTSDPSPSAVAHIKQCRPAIRHHIIPSLETLLDPEAVDAVPLNVTWNEYRRRPLVHIHSSGSTGLPKLVTLRHGNFSAIDAFQTLSVNEVGQRYANCNLCVPFGEFGIVV